MNEEIKEIITCNGVYELFLAIDSMTSLGLGECNADTGDCEFQVMDYEEDDFIKFLNYNELPFKKTGNEDDICFYMIKGDDINSSFDEEDTMYICFIE